MLLRSMKQAVYDGANLGHFGLALDAYAHFTSPIRRYPDLIVHRVIKAIINKNSGNKACKGAKFYSEEEIGQLGEQCSTTERRADDATRDVADWLKCEFMQDHVGDVFEGVVASVTNFGLFVRLSDYHIDGLVHITSLASDYYRYDDVKQCLVGESFGLSYRLGDALKVKVAAVNLDERKIDLILDGLPVITRNMKTAKGKGKNKADRNTRGDNPSSAKSGKGAATEASKDSASKSSPTSKRKSGPSSKRNKSSRNKPKR
jgi:ribonuclease R